MTNLALAHWGEHINGGGDRVAWELARVFADAPLYVGYRNASVEPNDVTATEISGGFGTNLGMKRGGAARMLSHLLRWQRADELRPYDTIITSGNEPLFYVAPDAQTWVAYIHHTNRRQSDLIDSFDANGLSGALKLLFYYMIRVAFDHNTHRPDLFVANSDIVKRRIMRYWGVPEKKIRVVYPPVSTHKYSPDDARTGDYYLTLSRLDWHKKVDEIVAAFNEMPDMRLVIAGDGSERQKLEEMSSPNVELTGYVNEERKAELLAGAKAFVFNAREEDFGISPVEALAAGTPLLGVAEGMTQFQVVDGKNGYTHVRPDEEGRQLRESVELFEDRGVEWATEDIAEFAERFSVGAFQNGIRNSVVEAHQRADFTPEWVEQYRDGKRSNSASGTSR